MPRNGHIETAHNVRRVGHLDIAGGGQVVIDNRGYAYVGHMKPPHGTSIIDVRDPKNPKVVAEVRLENDLSHTHKVRVVGDLMFTNVEQNDRHLKRKADQLDGLAAKLTGRLGRAPSDAELAAELKVTDEQIAVLREAKRNPYRDGGWKIYDISNRARPELIHYERTSGFGVHRFDVDASYAYISTEMDGYIGNILVIYDLKDPRKPTEVSRWWLPGQHLAGGETPTWRGYSNRLHHAMRVGDELWAAVWQAGIRVIDISDIRKPTTIASYDYHPPTPEPTHTILPATQLIGGRRIAVGVDEEHDHVRGQPHAHLWVVDVTHHPEIKPLSTFHVGENASPWSGAPGRFGAHQFQEHIDDTLVFAAWFSGGLRVIDIKDPEAPEEVGWFIPEPVGGNASPQSNDVDVDREGLIYVLDRNRGLDILEFKR
ncbi:MAG TPA: RNA polymerase subunit sigma-70 [Beijerinckiaceae bacterium]|nr:RNA polymerase subunit sigma-70 [Beijerinckiaceae bacterium]